MTLTYISGYPTIVFDKHKTQQDCAVCTGLRILIGRARAARNMTEASKLLRLAALRQKLELHNTIARMEKWGEAVREVEGKKRRTKLALTYDGYDTYKSSNFTRNGKPMADMKGAPGLSGAKGYAFKTQGVIAHGWGYFLYVLDPTISCNANFNIECVWRTLHKIFATIKADPSLERPTDLYIQVDGAPDNRCRCLFMFAEYLVRADVFDVVIISFLIVGHTHNGADRKFVPMTFELRKGCVKRMQDLVDIYWKAYKTDAPECVEIIESVGDYTEWLVHAQGSVFQGFKRNVPDHHRAHQFITSRTGDTEEGVKTDYKNLGVDGTVWNEGQEPIILLKGMPDPDGPAMQLPSATLQKQHLARLAAIRSEVFQHFRLNEFFGGDGENAIFSEADIKYSTDLFDSFCNAEGELLDLECCTPALEKMKKDYNWVHLPSMEKATSAAAEIIKHERGVAPIIHSGYSKKDYQAALAKAEEDTRKYEPIRSTGKYKGNISNAVKETMAEIEADLERVSREAKNAPRKVFKESCVVIGAYKHPGHEMLYLVEWNDDSVEWLPANKFDGFASLDASIEGEKVAVWWAERADATLASVGTSKWPGVLLSYCPDVETDYDEMDEFDGPSVQAELDGKYAFEVK